MTRRRRRRSAVESVNLPDSRGEARMHEALADEGIRGGDRGIAGHVGVVLVRGAAATLPVRRPTCVSDLDHLPVALEQGGVTAGPLVRPGVTPCLACRDAHERDRDPAWPRLHAQLIDRDCGPITSARVAEAAHAVRRVLEASAASPEGAILRVTAAGERAWSSVTFHAGCRCREQWFRSPRGSATAPALPAPPCAPTTARAYARPA